LVGLENNSSIAPILVKIGMDVFNYSLLHLIKNDKHFFCEKLRYGPPPNYFARIFSKIEL